MIRLTRTNSSDPDFISLVKKLDAELTIRNGREHSFYDQFNKIDLIKYVVLAYENEQPVACGGMKEYEPGTMEIKRMYTEPESRGKGIAGFVLTELEIWAIKLGYSRCILETGKRQPEAIALYKSAGYTIIPNYGQYVGVENSVCFENKLV